MRNRPAPRWACGVTTVPSRRDTYLPRCLASLAAAGFTDLRLFVDGGGDSDSWENEFGLPVTLRSGQPVRAFGGWVCALWELWARNPAAERFALFQDDAVFVKNLKGYLDRCRLDVNGKTYWNLFTYPPPRQRDLLGEGCAVPGWYPSNQYGRGALGLVFDRQGVIDLLSARGMVDRPNDTDRGHRNLDGAVVQALGGQRYVELVHNPSLCEHLGEVSAIGHRNGEGDRTRVSRDFPGEGFDATTWLGLTAPTASAGAPSAG